MDGDDEHRRQERTHKGDEPTPYQGLGYYTEEDSRWFFGRNRERTRIISNLRTSRLTILYAESGVGKSSLLRAGVVARLRELADPNIEQRGSARFVPIIFSDWHDEPLDPLLAAVETQAAQFAVPARSRVMAVHGTSVSEADSFERSRGNGDLPAGARESELAKAIARVAKTTDATVLVILDQFEEHFRYRMGQPQPERLADEIAACVNAPGLPVRFLIAVREDAYGGLGDLFRGRVGNVYRNYIHLEYLTRAAAREAIELPVKRYNDDHEHEPPVTLGDGLTDTVLEEVRRGNLALAPKRGESGVTEIPLPALPPDTDEIEAPFLQLVMERLWRCERMQGSRVLRKDTLDKTLGGAGRIVSDHLTDALAALTGDELATAKSLFGQLVTPSGAKIAHTAGDLVKITKAPEESVASVLRKLDEQRIIRAVDPAPGATESRYEVFHDKLAAAILDWLGQLEAEQLRLDKAKAEADKETAEEEARVQRAQAHRLRLLTICLGLLLLGLGGLAFYAFHQKSKADAERTAAINATALAHTTGRRAAYFGLTSRAESELSSRPDVALLLFLGAYGEVPATLAERSLMATLQDEQISGAAGILHGQTDAIEGVAFSPASSTMASASGDGTIRLWHVNRNSHYPLDETLRAGGPVLSVAFSPDGRSLASGSFNKLIVWTVANGGQVWVAHPGGAVTSVAFSPDGRYLAAASLQGSVFVWKTAPWKLAAVLKASPTEPVRSVAFSRRGDLLAAGESGGRVVLWNVAGEHPIRTLSGDKNDVYTVAFSPTSDTLAAAGAGRNIVLWNDANGRVRGILSGSDSFIYSLAFAPNGDSLAAGGTGDVELWNPVARTQVTPALTGQLGAVYAVAFSKDGRTLASAGADRTIRVWDYPIVRKYGVPLSPSHPHSVLSVAVARNGLIASGGSDGKIFVVGGVNHVPVTISAPGGLHAVVFAEGGRTLASAGNDGVIRLWNPITGQSLGQRIPSGHRSKILALASDPNGTTLLSGGGDGNVRVWNLLRSGEVGPPLTGDLGAVFAVAFDPNTREIAAAGNGRTIRVWTARGGGWVTSRAIGQEDALFALAFSPDGRELASGGADGTIRLWDLAASPTASPKTFVNDSDFVRGLAFSPDGTTLASASADQTVRLWDVASGAQLGDPLAADTKTVESVAFSPGGRFLVSGSDDRSVRLWPAPTLPPSFPAFRDEVCTFLGAGLNRTEWQQYAPDVQFQATCPRVTPG
jgi:WD40 repeat protein